jgi:hypothetical protein
VFAGASDAPSLEEQAQAPAAKTSKAQRATNRSDVLAHSQFIFPSPRDHTAAGHTVY